MDRTGPWPTTKSNFTSVTHWNDYRSRNQSHMRRSANCKHGCKPWKEIFGARRLVLIKSPVTFWPWEPRHELERSHSGFNIHDVLMDSPIGCAMWRLLLELAYYIRYGFRKVCVAPNKGRCCISVPAHLLSFVFLQRD